jgi:soluble lytic murein transglycosylase-like protein
MKSVLIMVQMLCAIAFCAAQSGNRTTRLEADYYVTLYAEFYRVPVALVRAIVQHESNCQVCSVSPKGAVAFTQLTPATAQRLGISDLSNLGQNGWGGVRYLAGVIRRFHNDLRLVAAAYYGGEDGITKRGLCDRNPDVIAYVSRIRPAYLLETEIEPGSRKAPQKRDVR